MVSMVAKIETTTQPKLYQCSFDGCSDSFPSAFRLKRHMRGHKGERPFICDIDGCDKSFTCKSYLNKHKKRPHHIESDFKSTKKRETRYNCTECFKEFKDKFLLQLHIAHHSGQKPFKCDKCDAAFALKSRLTRHSAIHLGFPCNHQDCGFVAETYKQLRKHAATMHKLINECSICGKVFSKKSNLQSHVDAHRFNCTIDGCEKSFVLKGQLKKHVEHDHQKSYICDQPGCGNKFIDRLTLSQHAKKHSPDIEKTKSELKKTIFPCRKSLAQELSGFKANKDELLAIFNHDKNFRKEI